MSDDNLMIISNYGLGDETFDTDAGSWNVGRAERDCAAGIHKTYGFEIDTVFDAIVNVDVEEEKIQAITAEEILTKCPPLIFVVEYGKVWLINGHHRVHAMKRLGIKECIGYVIEEKASAPYIMWFNGKRVCPWYGKEKQ